MRAAFGSGVVISRYRLLLRRETTTPASPAVSGRGSGAVSLIEAMCYRKHLKIAAVDFCRRLTCVVRCWLSFYRLARFGAGLTLSDLALVLLGHIVRLVTSEVGVSGDRQDLGTVALGQLYRPTQAALFSMIKESDRSPCHHCLLLPVAPYCRFVQNHLGFRRSPTTLSQTPSATRYLF